MTTEAALTRKSDDSETGDGGENATATAYEVRKGKTSSDAVAPLALP